MIVDDEARLGQQDSILQRIHFRGKHIINGIFSRSLGWTKSSGKGSNLCPWVIKHVNGFVKIFLYDVPGTVVFVPYQNIAVFPFGFGMHRGRC